jgi:ankyrin repeat protein
MFLHPHSPVQNGQTALSVAAQSGHLEVVQWLLTRDGLHVTALDSKGVNALLHAVTVGSPEIVQQLLGVPAMTGVEADDRGRTSLIQAAWVPACTQTYPDSE